MTVLRLREELSRYNLSALWWIVDPLVNTAVLYVLLVKILGFRDDNTAIFLFCGLIVWRMITSTLLASCNSLRAAQAVSLKINIHKSYLVMRDVFSESFKFLVSLLIVLIVLIAIGKLPVEPIKAPILFLLTVLFCLALAPFLAILGSLVADFSRVLSYFFRMLFFVSGIFFPLSRVPLDWQPYFLANPLALLVHEARNVFIYGGAFETLHTPVLVAVLFVVAVVGYYLLNRVNQSILKYMI